MLRGYPAFKAPASRARRDNALRDVPSLEIVTRALWPETPHLPLRVRFAIDALAAALPVTAEI
jgi:hypothetical protein